MSVSVPYVIAEETAAEAMLRLDGLAQLMGKKDGRHAGSKSSVIVVDDHPVVRVGLVQLINREPDLEVGGEASTVAEAMELHHALRPGVAVVDVTLPDGNGIDLARRLRDEDPDIRILVVSMHDETVFAERALAAGAMGFVNKIEIIDRLIEAIRCILRGEFYLSGMMSDRLRKAGLTHRRSEERTSIERLSRREREIFQLMGEGLTTREIAERLNISTKTVDTYRDQVKSKLRLNNVNELVRHAVQWLHE